MSIKDLVPRWGNSKIPIRRVKDGGLISFQHEVNRLFDDLFYGFGLRSGWDIEDPFLNTFNPRVNISETDKEINMSVELPGMDDKDVLVELDDTAVTIKGEKKKEQEEGKKYWHKREYVYGSFSRTIPLQSRIDMGKTKAKFKNGILSITLPKLEEDQKKRKIIDIEAN